MKECVNLKILLCLLMLVSPFSGWHAYAQSHKSTSAVVGRSAGSVVTGVVVDQDGEPLPGASVKIKGTKSGTGVTLTDVDGKFSIKTQAGSTLVVSFVGMARRELKAKQGTPMKITLEPDATQLAEVTVVDDGYNKLPRKDMVGAYTTVKAEDIMMPAYQSIDQMLQGRVAGMIVENSSTRVGSSPKISIRGTSTLLGNTDPLWVVDGVVQPDPLEINASDMLTEDLNNIIGNQISWLNPMDIETITVLKDASATAIYGSKASNGVIVITTKKGNADRVSVRYSGNVSVRMRSTYDNYNYMNSRDRIQFSKEAYDAGCRYQSEPLPQIYTYEGLMKMFNERLVTADEFSFYMQRLETGNTDWLDLLTRNSVSNSHNLSISGGNNKVTYNTSFGYSSNSGNEVGNDNDQFTSRLNVGIQFSKRLKATVNMNASIRNADGYAAGVSPASYALNMSRSVPAFDEDGERVYYKEYYNYKYAGQEQLIYGYNIFNEMENTYSKNTGKNFQVSANLDFSLFDWLTYQFAGSVVQVINDSEAYAGEKSSYVEKWYRGYPAGTEKSGSDRYKAAMLPYGGQLITRNSSSITYSMSHKLQFSKQINDNNRINALLGLEIRSVNSKSVNNTVYGYVPERGDMLVSPNYPGNIVPMPGVVTPVDWGVLDGIYKSGGWKKGQRTDNYLSYFGTVAYSLMNRYVVNANVRSDASNRFGQDTNHQFNPTYSFGFSWRMAEESFIQNNLWWLNQLNLSATYGIQGNVVNSISLELIASYNGIKGGYDEFYVTISSLPNPHLKWESTKSWNFGLALQLFNKYTMNLSYYGRRSNAIFSQDIAHEYGMQTMRLNGGIIGNHGFEMTFNFTPFQSKELAWTLGFNLSKNWNTSESSDKRIKANVITKDNFLSGSGNQTLKKGYPLTAFWSYSFAGLDPTNGYPTFNYLDVDTYDEEVDPTTFLVYSGSTSPYFTGGINTRVRYKDFSIGTSFSALVGKKRRLPNPYSGFTNGRMPSPLQNLSYDLTKRWKQPGDEAFTDIPALYTSVLNEHNLTTPDGRITSRYTMWAQSDARVADASFLRCNQISLSYYIPKAICGKFGAQSCQLSANVNNIFVIASKRWNGFDPETGSSRQPHIYSFGLSVSF